MWQFARNRLNKYGFTEPDASQLFETLKVACQNLMDKDAQFEFIIQTFIMQHSSVNGFVDKSSVNNLYDMSLDSARSHAGTKPSPKVAATTVSIEWPNRAGRRHGRNRDPGLQEGNPSDKKQTQQEQSSGGKGQSSLPDKSSQKKKFSNQSKGKGKKTTVKKYT